MWTVRAEQPEDVELIRRVHEDAFPTPDEAHLVDGLRASGNLALSLVAETNGRVIGHIAFSPVTSDPPSAVGVCWGLAPVAVLSEWQERGVGSRLITQGLEQAATACDAVVVLGEPEYYSRFGFEQASHFGLGNEYGVDEPFMVQELTPGTLTGLPAVIRYGPDFQNLG